ncbi:DUF4258 domain-containing protein [Alphaproteobacteria bacterium LSUCC0684]
MGPADATDAIRKLAQSDQFDFCMTSHAKKQITKREIVTGDLLYLFKNGFVYEEPEPSTDPNYWKYKIQGETPNSNQRQIAAVVIPDFQTNTLKIITIMWVDDT